MPTNSANTLHKPAKPKPAPAVNTPSPHAGERHSNIQAPSAKPHSKPSKPTAQPQKRPKATAKPAIPAPGPSQPNFISTNTLEYLGHKEHLCALTFDDGPTQHTPQLLKLLRERGIKATFFLLGSQVRRKPDLVRQIVAEGHEIGNHSYSHPKLSRLTLEQQRQEIAAVQALFHKLGVEGRFLRPPYGSFNKATLQVAGELDLDVILWSVDTNDWRHTLSIDGMSSRRGHDRPTRGVFLFHDTHLRTINALPTLIDFLEASQCRFVTLSEYVGKPPLAGLKPQVAPVAAPSPADAALPHQFPADDGSDDLYQDKPAAPSNAAKSPNTATEVVLPLQRGDAPAVTSHPADKQPGADTSVQVTPSERQPSTNEPNRIPMTWAPAPLPPAPSSRANDTRHTSGSTSQNEPASALPGTASTQSTPSGAIEPAPKTLSSPKTALPATSAQQMPTSSGGLQNTKAALNPSALSRQGVKPTPMQKTAPAQVTADPSAAPLQAPPSTSPLGPDRRTVTPSSPNTPLQQTGTVSPQSAVQAPSQPNQTAPSQGAKDSQDSGSFWKFFDLSL